MASLIPDAVAERGLERAVTDRGAECKSGEVGEESSGEDIRVDDEVEAQDIV